MRHVHPSRGRARLFLLALLSALTVATPARADIPAAVEAMIREAARSGDQATVDAVVKIAKATNPEDADAIATLAVTLVSEAEAEARRERERMLASNGYLQGWTGEGQLGVGLTSGNTEEVSGVLGLSLKKEGLDTRHKFDAVVDYLRTNGVTTRQKFGASYGLDYLLREGLYVYGIAGWEQDRFAGYARRFTQSLGAGVRAVNSPDMSLDVDAGPALRQTLFTDGTSQSDVGARASLTYRWTIRDGLLLSEDASVLSADGNTTLLSTTALSSRITGPLSARLSFKVQSETDPPLGSRPTDTATRATLVYKF